MALPKVDLSWMRPSDKVLNPTRGGRNAAIDTSIPSTITSRSIHHNASPRYLPSTAVGIRRPTTSLIDISHNRSGINSHAYMTPPMEPPIPEVKILYVLYSSAHLRITHWLNYFPADSVMGATGSGKSTVRSVLVVLPRKLTRCLCGLHSLLTSSAGPASTLVEDFNLVQTPYK